MEKYTNYLLMQNQSEATTTGMILIIDFKQNRRGHVKNKQNYLYSSSMVALN